MGPIAQSVEQRTFNPWVDGSSPSGPTSIFNVLIRIGPHNFSTETPVDLNTYQDSNPELLDHIRELRNLEYSVAIDSHLAILT